MQHTRKRAESPGRCANSPGMRIAPNMRTLYARASRSILLGDTERRSAMGTSRIQWTLAVAALVVYGSTITWGLPHATAADRTNTYATDSVLSVKALAEMHNTFVVSKPDRNYGYPWFHYFVVGSAQAPYVGLLMLTGGIEQMEAAYPFGMTDPARSIRWLTIIGRLVTVLMAVGVVLATHALGAALWGETVGVVAGFLTLLSYPMLYYSGTGNLDVPLTLWSTLGLVAFAKMITEGVTRSRAVWFGVFVALALATKDQALVVFLPLGLALLSRRYIGADDGRWPARPLLIGLGASIVVYIAATGMLVDPARHVTHVNRMLFRPEMLSVASAYFPSHPRTISGFALLSWEFITKLSWALSVPALVATVFGVGLAAAAHRRYLVLLLPLPTLFVMLSLPIGFSLLRYFLPLVPIFDVFAASALVARKNSRAVVRVLPLAVVLGWRAMIGADLVYAQLWETRAEAGAWMSAHAVTGDRVEYFGAEQKLPPLGSEIVSRRIAGREPWMQEFDHGPAIIEYLAAEGPEFVIVIPDWTSFPGMQRSADCPPEVFEALLDGSVGYREAAHFPRRTLLPSPLSRPPFDNPSVGPPVRIFVKEDSTSISREGSPSPGREDRASPDR